MRMALVRFGFLLAALVASLHVAGEPRFWRLTGVQLEDGAIATGYFSYDDATKTIANWNLRVSDGARHLPAIPFKPYTWVPGNSSANAYLSEKGPFLQFESLDVSPRFELRLLIAPLAPLDGNSAVVGINLEFVAPGEPCEDVFCWTGRAGSLVLAGSPPPVTIVQVDEFYHPGLRRYFITADAAEKQLLDSGVHAGWERTGESFKAYATGSRPGGSINPVCRYYGDPLRGLGSHFYSADAGECVSVFVKLSSEWLLESDSVFQVNLPDTATGACPAEMIPVYRLRNEHGASNHRYTTDTTIKAQMLDAGFGAEGYGPDGVVMCALQ